ncbi:hypothetical protein KRR38_08610 [Novosphingobium sp. G106]|uniref:hypothetical protein n=1 Tax=Novosphingobium sp. G106 TaxID=2849500 RepID=UPI001C2D5114|nr:hypothetical protein [Novosphingobium sp. G106]MBV1687733.1 hypothetical protein [Novosphingobium sp. G106]
MMAEGPDRLFEIYLALDDAYLHDAAPSLRTYTLLADFIDHTRLNNPASEFLPLAGRILVTLHRLQRALGNEVAGVIMDGSRHRLKKLCDEWLRACPLHVANSDLETLRMVTAT